MRYSLHVVHRANDYVLTIIIKAIVQSMDAGGVGCWCVQPYMNELLYIADLLI